MQTKSSAERGVSSWRNAFGLGLLFALIPTTLLVTLSWACQLQWLRRLWQGREKDGDRGSKSICQSVTTEFTVPEAVVGYVIGRHGARVRQVEEESGARIRFKDLQGSKDKVCFRDTIAPYFLII